MVAAMIYASESESDLHAGDCDGRIAVPCFIYLGARIFRPEIYRENGEGSNQMRPGAWPAACLTRYDGWFLAALLIVAPLIGTTRKFASECEGRPTRTDEPPRAPRIIKIF